MLNYGRGGFSHVILTVAWVYSQTLPGFTSSLHHPEWKQGRYLHTHTHTHTTRTQNISLMLALVQTAALCGKGSGTSHQSCLSQIQ